MAQNTKKYEHILRVATFTMMSLEMVLLVAFTGGTVYKKYSENHLLELLEEHHKYVIQ